MQQVIDSQGELIAQWWPRGSVLIGLRVSRQIRELLVQHSGHAVCLHPCAKYSVIVAKTGFDLVQTLSQRCPSREISLHARKLKTVKDRDAGKTILSTLMLLRPCGVLPSCNIVSIAITLDDRQSTAEIWETLSQTSKLKRLRIRSANFEAVSESDVGIAVAHLQSLSLERCVFSRQVVVIHFA